VTLSDQRYRRGAGTWVVFGALFGFGVINSVLGPVLPFLRDTEHLSYIAAAVHQVAFAIGGMTAGFLASRSTLPRKPAIGVGLAGAALSGLLLGYGRVFPVTVLAALLMSAFATTALIRLWALVADLHAAHRAVAMTEGEVAVSLAGILTPMVVTICAATAAGWRFSFVVAAVLVGTAALVAVGTHLPTVAPGEPNPSPPASSAQRGARRTLAAIFAVVALEFALSFWAATYLHDDVGLGRDQSVALVSALYAANLVGRLLASRLARRVETAALLRLSLLVTLLGTPVLLAAGNTAVAAAGLALTGAGIGGTFPLASALHVGASERSADQAMGQVIAIAGFGVITGPVAAGAIAEGAGLRVGLLVLPALVLFATAMARPGQRRNSV
jgi:fucose permease